MKIALYYCGVLRTMKYCYKKVLKNFEGHEVDVFLSIWDIPGTSLKNIKDKSKAVNIFPELEYKNINEELIRKEFPDINFAIIDIEKIQKSNRIQAYHYDNFRDQGYKWVNLAPLHYKMNRCNDMRKDYEREKDIKYDWFIRLATDGSIHSIPKLEIVKKDVIIFNKYDTERVIDGIPPHKSISTITNKRIGEYIFMTNNSDLMDIMCDKFKYIPSHWKEMKMGVRIYYTYLKFRNLLRYVIIHDFKIEILRSHGYKQVPGKLRKW